MSARLDPRLHGDDDVFLAARVQRAWIPVSTGMTTVLLAARISHLAFQAKRYAARLDPRLHADDDVFLAAHVQRDWIPVSPGMTTVFLASRISQLASEAKRFIR